MGWFGSFCSGVGSFCSSCISGVASGISSAWGSVGGFLGSLGSKAAGFFGALGSIVSGPLGSVIGPIVAQIVVKVVVKVIVAIATKLGIIKDKEEMIEDGYRLEEASKREDLKKREEFPSTEVYLEYLRTQIPSDKIDRVKLEEKKDEYEFLGAQACIESWEEVLQVAIPNDFLIEIGRCNLNRAEVEAIVAAFKAIGHNKADFRSYLQGTMSGVVMDKFTDALMVKFKEIYPDKTENQIWDKIEQWKKYSRDDSALKKVVYKEKIEQITKDVKEGKQPRDIDFEVKD